MTFFPCAFFADVICSELPVIMNIDMNIMMSKQIAYSAVPNDVDVLAWLGPCVITETIKCGTQRIRAAHFSPVRRRSVPKP